MGTIPHGARRGRGGKLIEVLDHQLRVGNQETSDKVLAAFKERGLTPPEHIETPPGIRQEFFVYWEAFQDLQSERMVPRGTIPVSAIIEYATHYGLNSDTLKRIVWKADRVLLDYWAEQDEIQKNKQKAESDRNKHSGSR